MKKIFILSLCLMSLISLSVSASNTILIKDSDIVVKTVTVDISTENFSEDDDITLLVFKPDDEHPEPDLTNIVAINQADYKSGMTSITFSLPENAEGIYEIRIGGTNVETYTSGKFTVTKYSLGDLNRDGNYDDIDAILVLRVFLEIDEINMELKILDETVDKVLYKINNQTEYIEKGGSGINSILLYGPPGLGKTTLAGIIANELGVDLRITSGPAIARAGDLAAILTNLKPSEVSINSTSEYVSL